MQIFFEITNDCNMHCLHCCKQSLGSRDSVAMSKAMLNIIAMYPKTFLKISGGEPGLYKDKVFYTIDHNDCPISINTNGSLWTEDDIEIFNEHDIHLAISIPSINKEEYYNITGTEYALNSKVLSKCNPDKVTVTIIVNPFNCNAFGIFSTMQVLKETYGFYQFNVSPQVPSNTSITYTKALHTIELAYKLFDYKYKNFKIQLVGEGPITSSLLKYDHKCNAGIGRLVILANGDVVPCACKKFPILGNILEDSYNTLVTNGLKFWNSYSPELKFKCKGFYEVPDDART